MPSPTYKSGPASINYQPDINTINRFLIVGHFKFRQHASLGCKGDNDWNNSTVFGGKEVKLVVDSGTELRNQLEHGCSPVAEGLMAAGGALRNGARKMASNNVIHISIQPG